MKKMLILVLIALGICLWIFYPASKNQNLYKKSLKVKAESPTLDLGNIKKDSLKSDNINAIFKVKNISSSNLVIKDIYTGCWCATADFTKDTIKPNTWFNINATYKDLSPGYFEQNLRVSFSDSTSLPLLLTLRGKIL